MLTLEVTKRERIGKASKRRLSACGNAQAGEAGALPAVFYGPKEESTPITLSEKDFMKVWSEAGESSVIELAGLGEPKEALIHEVDVDPVSGRVRHADFYVIEKGKKIEVNVPLEFIGEAPAVKELGGTLVKVLHEITVEVMPKDLPHDIKVDVSGLVDFDKQILVSDLKLGSEIEVLTDPEEVIALVSEVKEEVEEPTEAPDLSSIEVEKKGKEEDEASAESGTEQESK